MRTIPCCIWDGTTGTLTRVGSIRVPNNPLLRKRRTKRAKAVKPDPHACCHRAQPVLGYAFAYTCTVHGDTRIGTSD